MNQHKGSVLILTLSLLTSAVVLVLVFLSMIKHDMRLFNSRSSAIKAFYVAEAGLNKALWYLLNTAPDTTASGTWRTSAYPSAAGPDPNDPREESFGGGTYVIWVEDSATDILVSSLGTFQGAARTVQQKVNIVFTPHAFKYAVFSGGEIDLDNSDGSLSGPIASRANIVLPLGVAVNGHVLEGSSVNVPAVDISGYEAMADTVINGDQTFTSGTYAGLWYVDGDVFIESDVALTGSIVATGDITIQGQTNINLTAANSMPVLLSSSNILISNSSAINLAGLIYSQAEVLINDVSGLVINGAIVGGSRIMAQNSPNLSLTYDPRTFSLPAPFFSDGTDSKTLTAVADSWKMN